MLLLEWLPSWLVWLCFTVGFLSLTTYLVPVVYQSLFFGGADKGGRDFRRLYGAQWALVTGGSSGIGRAIVERLARQRIHVVIVALDDQLLRTAIQELRLAYPDVQFMPVGVDLGGRLWSWWCLVCVCGLDNHVCPCPDMLSP